MITQKQQRRYFQFLKQRGGFRIAESQFEKDYQLSLFLSELQQAAQNQEIRQLQTLIFKGGTLLTKAYLAYHRISEDIDFTHPECNYIRGLESINQQETAIKKIIEVLFDEVQHVANKAGLDFVHDRTNNRYVEVRNSRAVYTLHLYYKSAISNQENKIKLEVNFVEQLQHPPVQTTIRNLPDILNIQEEVKLLGITLTKPTLPSYLTTEIALEKFRAILTRPQPKERDIFDLFLLNTHIDVFDIPITDVSKKIRASQRTVPNYTEALNNTCKQLSNESLETQEDVHHLSLRKLDTKQYDKFKNQLFKHLQRVCSRIKKNPQDKQLTQ